MEKLIQRFNRIHPGYVAELDKLDSYRGCYWIWITEPVCGISSRYFFASLRDFRDWMDGIVLD